LLKLLLQSPSKQPVGFDISGLSDGSIILFGKFSISLFDRFLGKLVFSVFCVDFPFTNKSPKPELYAPKASIHIATIIKAVSTGSDFFLLVDFGLKFCLSMNMLSLYRW
jgi:hypothetical protein